MKFSITFERTEDELEERILKACELLKNAAKGGKITYDCKPDRKTGCVTVIGKNIMFDNSSAFMDVVDLANTFEVFPKVDGTIQMDFTFYRTPEEVQG